MRRVLLAELDGGTQRTGLSEIVFAAPTPLQRTDRRRANTHQAHRAHHNDATTRHGDPGPAAPFVLALQTPPPAGKPFAANHASQWRSSPFRSDDGRPRAQR